MPINAPRYHVDAQSQTTPINIVTGTDALTGGAINRVDRGGGTYVFRFTGSDSTAGFTALATNSDGTYESPGESPIVMAVRAIVQTDPSGSFTRFVAFSSTTTPDDGSYIMKNGASNSQKLRSPDLADEVVVNDVIGASLKTIVWRITPGTSGNVDIIEAWVETVGRSGSAPDFTSSGANLTESRMAFDTCIVRPEDGTLDVARIAIFPPEALSNANCAALADDFDATIGVSGGGTQNALCWIRA